MTAPERTETKGPALVLVGPPGAGKSSVGRLVADRLGLPFRDTDDDIAAAAGQSIPELFFTEGEEGFRAREEVAVAAALAGHPGVLALGGGAVLSARTRELLRGRRVVFLSVRVAEALHRLGLARDRPVLALSPQATLRSLLADRLPRYREVATTEVDTSDRPPDAVAQAVLDWWEVDR
ncbi:MAG: shikimate kinase [Mycobacteriales bacterium]